MLERRLKLGTFWGIGLYVHWTFALLILFFSYQASGRGLVGILFALAIVAGVFFCVTLHEYGHALAARRFGISTVDITLLPIGGVARLQRMPRVPWQELVVAVAGPAVNVVIAFALLSGLLLSGQLALQWAGGSAAAEPAEPSSPFGDPSLLGFAIYMMVVNIMLVLFNMIPAFPMDGGRVFRSVLAMMMDYRRATRVASRVGLMCAAAMALLTLYFQPSNPFPILIAVFIGFAGIAEARQVEVSESVRGLTVREVMIASNEAIPMDMPLWQIAHTWQTRAATALPVLSIVGTVIGMLRLDDVTAALAGGVDPRTTAGQLVNHSAGDPPVGIHEDLEMVIARVGNRGGPLPVVLPDGRLAGILEPGSMLMRGRLAKQLSDAPLPEHRFEALS